LLTLKTCRSAGKPHLALDLADEGKRAAAIRTAREWIAAHLLPHAGPRVGLAFAELLRRQEEEGRRRQISRRRRHGLLHGPSGGLGCHLDVLGELRGAGRPGGRRRDELADGHGRQNLTPARQDFHFFPATGAGTTGTTSEHGAAGLAGE